MSPCKGDTMMFSKDMYFASLGIHYTISHLFPVAPIRLRMPLSLLHSIRNTNLAKLSTLRTQPYLSTVTLDARPSPPPASAHFD